MGKRYGLAGLVVALALAGPARAEGRQITWTVFDAPPYTIVEGENRDNGAPTPSSFRKA